MIDWLDSIDRLIYTVINNDWTAPFFDCAMPLITDQETGVFLILAILTVFAVLGGRKGKIAAIAAILTVAFIDPVGHYLLKPLFARARPCHLEIGRLLVECGSGFSMPSLHAANSFGVFSALTVRYRWKVVPFLIIPIAVGYSRIYVGVHWPGDVLAGFIFGAAVGITFGLATDKLVSKYLPKKKAIVDGIVQ